MSSFVPRLNLHIKPYKHIVSEGERAQDIAEMHGAGEGGYRELLAANLPRKTRPTNLGGSATFAELVEGERLNVPSHWSEKSVAVGLSGIPGMLGEPPVLDTTNPLFVAASASAHSQFDTVLANDPNADAFLGSVINAAVQWYANMDSSGTVTDTGLMDRLVYNAAIWSDLYGSAMSQDQAGKFAWGPFGMMLSSPPVAWDTVQWTDQTPNAALTPPSGFNPTLAIPPGLPSNADWSWIPWDLLGAQGSLLETVPSISPITYPAQVDQAVTRATWQNAINAALQAGPGPVDCPDGYKHVDPNDDTSMCVSLCADPAQYNPTNATCCPLGSSYSAATSTCDCGPDMTFDASTNVCRGAAPDPTTDTAAPAKKSGFGTLVVVGAIATAAWFGGKAILKEMKKSPA